MKISASMMTAFQSELRKHAAEVREITKEALIGRGLHTTLGGAGLGLATSAMLSPALAPSDPDKSTWDNIKEKAKVIGAGTAIGAAGGLAVPAIGRAGLRGVYGATGKVLAPGGRGALYDEALDPHSVRETIPGLVKSFLNNPKDTVKEELHDLWTPHGTEPGMMRNLHRVNMVGMGAMAAPDLYHAATGDVGPDETRGQVAGRAAGYLGGAIIGQRLPWMTSLLAQPLIDQTAESVGKTIGQAVGG